MRVFIACCLMLALAAPAVAQRYVDRENLFSVTVPEGWSGAKQPEQGTLLCLQSPDRSLVFSVMARARGEIASAEQVEEILYRQATRSGLEVVAREDHVVGGIPARSLSCRSAGGLERTTTLLLGPRVYFLQVAAPSEKAFHKSAQLLDSLVASFRPELSAEHKRRALQNREQARREQLRYERLRRERLRRERLERERY